MFGHTSVTLSQCPMCIHAWNMFGHTSVLHVHPCMKFVIIMLKLCLVTPQCPMCIHAWNMFDDISVPHVHPCMKYVIMLKLCLVTPQYPVCIHAWNVIMIPKLLSFSISENNHVYVKTHFPFDLVHRVTFWAILGWTTFSKMGVAQKMYAWARQIWSYKLCKT